MNNTITHNHSYKGYVYQPSEDVDSDNIKIFHHVLAPNGACVKFDWSPYQTPTEEQFALWVDLGCPERVGIGPLRDEDLKTLANNI